MGHERLKHIKENLMSAVESQICQLGEVDAEELGSAIDMIKDLEEALYFCTITEAMNGKEKGGNDINVEMEKEYHKGSNGGERPQMYYSDLYYNYNRPSDMMYYNGGGQGGNSGSSGGGRGGSSSGSSSSNYSEPMSRDYREGRSPQNRRMYMEAKEKQHDKNVHLRELEKYAQELTSDIVEMIQDATQEEKQYLEKKISALASKIGQMK